MYESSFRKWTRYGRAHDRTLYLSSRYTPILVVILYLKVLIMDPTDILCKALQHFLTIQHLYCAKSTKQYWYFDLKHYSSIGALMFLPMVSIFTMTKWTISISVKFSSILWWSIEVLMPTPPLYNHQWFANQVHEVDLNSIKMANHDILG